MWTPLVVTQSHRWNALEFQRHNIFMLSTRPRDNTWPRDNTRPRDNTCTSEQFLVGRLLAWLKTCYFLPGLFKIWIGSNKCLRTSKWIKLSSRTKAGTWGSLLFCFLFSFFSLETMQGFLLTEIMRQQTATKPWTWTRLKSRCGEPDPEKRVPFCVNCRWS